ncbi:autotransporter strand-loop-strand O-heptosyltransferase [Acetobacter pomorum]|uniref:Autotransporter strand-loop-strand O-heptosyltransferase n=1 Tax=Acetobacter pomorum TaxID=65959 RepID=A0A2G4R7V7_9PROT|nr:autotransporter strand-loop-strand O-heptosyltransferase [Acetobacter pomorum]PHY92636.1 autotransporter strand-loop-strand O-heptosyltransferase [Acetobacter pomorum]GBR54011.1 glycosyltransferase [Acetobacter pomorum DSM 11825]
MMNASSTLLEVSPSASAQQQSAGSEKTDGKATTPYVNPALQPTQVGPEGILFDFNLGARVVLPERSEGKWRVILRDLDTGNILFINDNAGATVHSAKRYYVRFRIEVDELKTDGSVREVLRHDLDCKDRKVVIQFPVGTLGDTLAWFSYAARFASEHNARVTCILSDLIIPLIKNSYPELNLISPEEARNQEVLSDSYAMYCLGLFFDDAACNQQPTDFRFVGLHRTAGYILGVDPSEEAPRLALPDETRPIEEKYVCIAVQASTQCKYWNNPDGWRKVVQFLKQQGYRVICIDQKPVHGTGIVWNYIPHGAEDETGNRPLVERARWLRHADLFIGLSSGLAWLAWAAGTPVVMISGFTHPTNEFHTPYRIINWHACNSCWNDIRERFDHKDFLWCPRHANTPRQFECTRLITSEQVIRNIQKALVGIQKTC